MRHHLEEIFGMVRVVLLGLLAVMVLTPVFSLHLSAGALAAGDDSAVVVSIEHRMTAVEVKLENTSELVRAAVLGVGGLVLETLGRALKAWTSKPAS